MSGTTTKEIRRLLAALDAVHPAEAVRAGQLAAAYREIIRLRDELAQYDFDDDPEKVDG